MHLLLSEQKAGTLNHHQLTTDLSFAFMIASANINNSKKLFQLQSF